MSNLQEYKCPECGGAIAFDSQVQQMKCQFCDTTFEVEALKAFDDALHQEQPAKMNWEQQSSEQWREDELTGLSVYSCQSCGGEIVGGETMAATKCPFCDNPVVVTGQFSGDLRPNLVIPFKLAKQDAIEALSKHLLGKKLLPKIFKDQNRIEEIKGVYVPFWLFDSDTSASIHYKATKLRTWMDSSYNYTETSYYHVLREGTLGFEHVPVDGSSKMADDLMESLEPYDYAEAVDFQTAYLAGYLADKYDVDAEQSIARANERVKNSVEDAFRNTVTGYSSVTAERSHVHQETGKVCYALLPVWMLTTAWNGKNYTFAMNGQTGKFVGDLPLDKGAYWRWFGGLSALIGAAALAAQAIISIF